MLISNSGSIQVLYSKEMVNMLADHSEQNSLIKFQRSRIIGFSINGYGENSFRNPNEMEDGSSLEVR